MIQPYISPATLDGMYKHFARRAYEHHHAFLRKAYKEGGLETAFSMHEMAFSLAQHQQKMSHILHAIESAWDDFANNCPELDITPIARALHWID